MWTLAELWTHETRNVSYGFPLGVLLLKVYSSVVWGHASPPVGGSDCRMAGPSPDLHTWTGPTQSCVRSPDLRQSFQLSVCRYRKRRQGMNKLSWWNSYLETKLPQWEPRGLVYRFRGLWHFHYIMLTCHKMNCCASLSLSGSRLLSSLCLKDVSKMWMEDGALNNQLMFDQVGKTRMTKCIHEKRSWSEKSNFTWPQKENY